MRFEWDEHKNRHNLRKHDVRFETAVLVFDDPYAISQRDQAFEDEESFASSRHVLPSRMKGRRMRKLTKQQKRDIRVIAGKRDEEIDFSEAAPVLDWSGAEMGKFYRPKKKPVTMRLDSDVIAWLKAEGRGYQTKANWLLRQAMTHFTKKASSARRGKRGQLVKVK